LGGANFAGYAYGNWDADKDGFAYGYPIGVNYALQCRDTIFERRRRTAAATTSGSTRWILQPTQPAQSFTA
jgi:hypothetical protein